MSDNTVWSLEAGSEVNSEGKQIIFNVKVTTPTASPVFTGTNKVQPDETNTTADANIGNIGAISGYRFRTSDAALINAGDPALANTIDTAGISDVANPVTEGSDWVVRFKYRITLASGGHIAVNNGLSGVSIYQLTAGWLTLYLTGGITVPAKVISHGAANLSASAVTVGMPPFVTGVAIYTDAHAEAVANSNATVNHLTLWHDLSGAGTNLTGKPNGSEPSLTAGNKVDPDVTFASSVPNYFQSGSMPPAITLPATAAAV